MGEGNTSRSLTVTFNRALTSSEKSSFNATLVVVENGEEIEWTLREGIVQSVGDASAWHGSYSFSGNNLVVSLVGDTTLWEFYLNS